ncbi:melatonin receptor type 1B-B-like [Oculina patagonica]
MENGSHESTILNSRDKLTVAIEGGLMLLINLAALSGNFLMCFVMFMKPRFHTTTNMFIVSLAMCYMFASCLVIPFTAGSLMAGEWPFGQPTCDIQGFVFLSFTWVSLQTLTILAASRYFKVVRFPFYNKWFSLNRSIGIILAMWVLAVLVLIIPLTFGTATFQFQPERSICSMPVSKKNQTENITNTVITLALFTALPITSIIAWCANRKHETYLRTSLHFERSQTRSEDDLKAIAEERKTNKILFALITEVMFLWLPAIIINMLEFPIQSVNAPRQIQLASTFLWFAVPVLHPITYGVLCRPFAKEVIKVIPRSSLRRNKVHAEEAV